MDGHSTIQSSNNNKITVIPFFSASIDAMKIQCKPFKRVAFRSEFWICSILLPTSYIGFGGCSHGEMDEKARSLVTDWDVSFLIKKKKIKFDFYVWRFRSIVRTFSFAWRFRYWALFIPFDVISHIWNDSTCEWNQSEYFRRHWLNEQWDSYCAKTARRNRTQSANKAANPVKMKFLLGNQRRTAPT